MLHISLQIGRKNLVFDQVKNSYLMSKLVLTTELKT